jgi:hypothetical protein
VLDSRPLVVTDLVNLPQVDWPRFDDYQWLAPGGTFVSSTMTSMEQAGVGRFVLFSGDLDAMLKGTPYRLSTPCRSDVAVVTR